MKIKILSWNVRGLNIGERRQRIKSNFQKWKADIIVLQESKVDSAGRDIIKELWASNFVDWTKLGARGTVGGILILWDSRMVSQLDEVRGNFSLSCLFKSLQDDFEWVLSGVYGPNDDAFRPSFWEELEEVNSRWDKPWCLSRDFNVVRFPNERKGYVHSSLAMNLFSELVDSNELIDPPTVGVWFT